MNCVTSGCDNEARTGHYHCEGHEEKLQHGFSEGFHDSVMEFVRKELPPLGTEMARDQRSLITAVRQARQDAGLALVGTYEGIALVLRTAVDRGELMCFEKNERTFYRVNSASEPQHVYQRWHEAANERDKLRAEVADLQSRLVRLIQERDDLQLENQRLKLAVESYKRAEKEAYAVHRQAQEAADERIAELTAKLAELAGKADAVVKEAAETPEAPLEVKCQQIVQLLLQPKPRDLAWEMVHTGLYGKSMVGFVRGALLRIVRDYVVDVKGKM